MTQEETTLKETTTLHAATTEPMFSGAEATVRLLTYISVLPAYGPSFVFLIVSFFTFGSSFCFSGRFECSHFNVVLNQGHSFTYINLN